MKKANDNSSMATRTDQTTSGWFSRIRRSFGDWTRPLAGLCAAVAAALLAVRGRPLIGLVVAAGAVDFAAIMWNCSVNKEKGAKEKGRRSSSDGWANIPADTTLREIVNLHANDRGIQNYVVRQGNQIVGSLALKTIESIPKQHWAEVRARELMTPVQGLRRHRLTSAPSNGRGQPSEPCGQCTHQP
jgi:hypothetical protein